MQNTTGPCQLWAIVPYEEHPIMDETPVLGEPPLTLAFVSTSFNQWLNYAFRCEDKVLCGILGCVVDDTIKYLKVLRFGSKVQNIDQSKLTKSASIEKWLSQHHGEIVVHPEDDFGVLLRKVGDALNCDPNSIRM
jgi:hypothetical protein